MMEQVKDGRFLFLIFLLLMLFSCESNRVNDPEISRLKKSLRYKIQDSVELNLSFMGYACGDCYPQYRVDSVLFSENGDYDFYFNKEIHVELQNNELEKKENNLKCSGTCYNYQLVGHFMRNELGIGKLVAFKGEIKEDKICCEEDGSY